MADRVTDHAEGYDLEPGDVARCAGRNRHGKPCRLAAQPGEGYCEHHIGQQDSDQEQERPPSQADLIVALATQRYDLGVSTNGEPFAVPKEGHGPYVARMLRGGQNSLRAELAVVFADLHDRVPSASALADAMLVLEGRARAADPVELALRVARHEDGIVLDLGAPDGTVVVVTPEGWQLTDRSPVLFRRTITTGELPRPKPGASLDELRRLINVSDESWPLLVAWLVAALIPDFPHPIVVFTGEHGTGKSTASWLLVRVVDESPVPIRKPPKDPDRWVTAVAGTWVLGIDNLTAIPDWFSDSLCRAVTGEGDVRRALYTDGDQVVFAFRRAIVLNGIDLGALKGDLAQRSILLDLERIDPLARLEEDEVPQVFAEAQPRVLGALLELTGRTLRALPEVRLERRPRMAAFARVVAAVDQVLGTNALRVYEGLTQRTAAEVVEGDPVGRAIRDYMASHPAWKGTAGELRELLDPKQGDWPDTPQAMAGALKKIAPALREIGIPVDYLGQQGHTKRGTWRLGGRGEGQNEEGGESATAATAPPAQEQTPSSEAMRSAGISAGIPAAPNHKYPQTTRTLDQQTRRSTRCADSAEVAGSDFPPLSEATPPPPSPQPSAPPPVDPPPGSMWAVNANAETVADRFHRLEPQPTPADGIPDDLAAMAIAAQGDPDHAA